MNQEKMRTEYRKTKIRYIAEANPKKRLELKERLDEIGGQLFMNKVRGTYTRNGIEYKAILA